MLRVEEEVQGRGGGRRKGRRWREGEEVEAPTAHEAIAEWKAQNSDKGK